MRGTERDGRVRRCHGLFALGDDGLIIEKMGGKESKRRERGLCRLHRRQDKHQMEEASALFRIINDVAFCNKSYVKEYYSIQLSIYYILKKRIWPLLRSCACPESEYYNSMKYLYIFSRVKAHYLSCKLRHLLASKQLRRHLLAPSD